MENIFHKGEVEAQQRFGDGDQPDTRAEKLAQRLLKSAIDDETAYFIEGQSFFFFASADAQGNCDCSFKGIGEQGSPCIQVLDSKTVLFPDYSGNGLFNTLGNILVNPNVGLLFVDFTNALRLRLNGRAVVIEDMSEHQTTWPKAKRLIKIKVATVYPNCSRNIPKLEKSIATNQGGEQW